jgi:DNA repair protein RecN (Recombination protein N)
VLRDLHIRNLAVVEETRIEFGPGLNILTGETGAGKSIVVDSLALLGGSRASGELIRSDADVLSVTGVFEPDGDGWREVLEQAGLESAGSELMVRREISRAGRNRVFVDDRPVTLGLLASMAPHLLGIHTQREELGLVSPELQRRWLDRSGGRPGQEISLKVRRLYCDYAELRARLERITGDERLRLERIDLLQFQAGEIDAARLETGEEESLRRERSILRHSEAIREALGTAYVLLLDDDDSAVDRIARAQKQLETVSEWQSEAAAWSETLGDVRIGLEDIARELGQRLAGVAADPGRLNAVEERLAQLERLFRKYQPSSEDTLAQREEIRRELEELEGDTAQREELVERVDAALAVYREAAIELSARREEWGEKLVGTVHRELADLAMKRARFQVKLERRRSPGSRLTVVGEAVEFSAEGFDRVVFQLSANPGEEMLPLARSASGGELSRVYLAVQLGVRGDGKPAGTTLVFDEVDSGIGGAEAAALGRKLRRLARGGQILVVTHLPQVASHADRHFKVAKRVIRGRTCTWVDFLDPPARTEEVARMLGGKKVTALSRSHAEELIAAAERGG